jgi:hypothetical protein
MGTDTNRNQSDGAYGVRWPIQKDTALRLAAAAMNLAAAIVRISGHSS